MREIETKLDVGDSAFFIEDNEIKEEEVEKIEVSVSYNAYYGTSTTEVTYTLKGFKDQKKLKEKEAFTSLKEVLQYLEDRFESSKVVKPL